MLFSHPENYFMRINNFYTTTDRSLKCYSQASYFLKQAIEYVYKQMIATQEEVTP